MLATIMIIILAFAGIFKYLENQLKKHSSNENSLSNRKSS